MKISATAKISPPRAILGPPRAAGSQLLASTRLCRRRRTTAHDRLGENAHLLHNATLIIRMHHIPIALCVMIGCCLPATAVTT